MTWELENAGTRKTLDKWGFEICSRSLVSLDTSTVRLRQVVSEATTEPLARGSTVAIYRDSVCWFYGIVTSCEPNMSGQDESWEIIVADPWYYLTKVMYQQLYSGATRGYSTQVFLFINPNYGSPGSGMSWSVLEQLQDIINFVSGSTVGAPLQLGTIPTELASLYLPADEKTDLRCADAVRESLRCSPDVGCYFDYSTTKSGAPCPTIHFFRRYTATELNIAATELESVNLKRHPDWEVSAVKLVFSYTHQVDGVSSQTFAVQAAPVGCLDGNGNLLPAYALDAMVQTIDLEGISANNITAELTVSPVQPSSVDWWTAHNPGLLGVSNLVISADAYSGPANELIAGAVAQWMRLGSGTHAVPVTAEPVTLQATVTYDTAGNKGITHQVYAEFTGTNGETGEYSTVGVSSVGEDEPPGLAQFIYDSLKDACYQGTFEVVDEEVGSIGITIGAKVNITGGKTGWDSMQALVQAIDEDVHDGRTVVTLGLPRHLAACQIVEMFRWNRTRLMKHNPAMLNDATVAGTSDIQLGHQTANTWTADQPIGHMTVEEFRVGKRLIVGSLDGNYIDLNADNCATVTIRGNIGTVYIDSSMVHNAQFRMVKFCEEGDVHKVIAMLRDDTAYS